MEILAWLAVPVLVGLSVLVGLRLAGLAASGVRPFGRRDAWDLFVVAGLTLVLADPQRRIISPLWWQVSLLTVIPLVGAFAFRRLRPARPA